MGPLCTAGPETEESHGSHYGQPVYESQHEPHSMWHDRRVIDQGAAAGSQRLATGLRAFRYRDFRLFAAGQFISLIGTWMQQVAQAWLVLTLGGDALTLGALAAAQFLPVVVFGLFGGVVADVLPKRATLVLTQVWAMALAFILFGLTASGRVEVWQIFVLAVLLGLSNALEMPTRQAFVIDLVDRADLRNAIALNAAMFHGARIIGPAIAGVTIGLIGVSAAFFVNGVSFLVVIVSLLMIRGDQGRAGETGNATAGRVSGVLASLAEGLRYVRGTPIVLLSVAVVGIVATFAMNFQVLGPVLAEDVLGSGPTGFGFLMAAVGVGAFVAAMAIAFAPRPEPRIIAVGAMALGVASIMLAASRSFPISALAMLDRRCRGDRDGGDRQRDDPDGRARSPARTDHQRVRHDPVGVRPAGRDPDRRDRHDLGSPGRVRHRWCRRPHRREPGVDPHPETAGGAGGGGRRRTGRRRPRRVHAGHRLTMPAHPRLVP